MGYNTRFSLDIKPMSKRPLEELIGYLEKKDEYCLLSLYINCGETSKWYAHEENMKDISTQFSDFLFTLSGQGEEAGDIWTKYFLGGKMQVAKAVIVVPEFDPKLLK